MIRWSWKNPSISKKHKDTRDLCRAEYHKPKIQTIVVMEWREMHGAYLFM